MRPDFKNINITADAFGGAQAPIAQGEEWLTPTLFRIGTSRLANLLLTEVLGEEVKIF